MEPESTTCSQCNRAMYVKDVDRNGRCPDCPMSKSYAARITEQVMSESDPDFGRAPNKALGER